MSLRRKLGLPKSSKDGKDVSDANSSQAESLIGDENSSIAGASVDESRFSQGRQSKGLNLFGGPQHSLLGSRKTSLASIRGDTPVDMASQEQKKAQKTNGSLAEGAIPIGEANAPGGVKLDESRRKSVPKLVSPIGQPDVQRDTSVPRASTTPVNPVGDMPPVPKETLLTESKRLEGGPSESNVSEFSDFAVRNEVDPLELEQEYILKSETGGTKLNLVAVTLKEAALDSPTFRASFTHLNTQATDLLEWCDNLLRRTGTLDKAMGGMRDLANDVIETFMPSFASQGLLGQEYTTLAFVRYSQSIKGVWTEIIMRLSTHQEQLKEQFAEIRQAHKPYAVLREKFVKAQATYDQAQADYMAMSKSETPAELQKAQKRVSDLRRKYLILSIELTSQLSHFRLVATSSLLMALSDPMQIYRKCTVPNLELAIDLHRLRQLANSMKLDKSEVLSGLLNSCGQLKTRVEETDTGEDVTAFTPDKLSLPTHFKPKVSAETPLEQFGWVYIKNPAAKNQWVRRWAFIKNGLFGWLSLSPDNSYVLESDKVAVGDCDFRPAPDLPRRYCFCIEVDNIRVTVQAESFPELEGWLTVADAVSRTHVTLPSRLHPWAPEFASPKLAESLERSSTPPTSSSAHRHHGSDHLRRFVRKSAGLSRKASTSSRSDAESLDTASIKTADPSHVFGDITLGKSFSSLLESVEATQYIDGLSTLGPSSQGMLAPPVMPVVPMPTSMTPWALVGYSFLKPMGFPNALTANFWGSVNWTTYQPNKQRSVHYRPMEPEYPDFYPKELIAQDMIRRALFENLVLPGEYLVTMMRGFARLKENQWVPARIYATNRRLLHHISVFDYSTLRSVRYSSILDVECKTSVDYDDLQVIVRNPESENGEASEENPPYSTVVLRIYIDSGVLMQRRLQYILDNFKSEKPDDLEKMLAELARINKQFAEDVQRRIGPASDETQILGTLWSDIDRALKGPMTQQIMSGESKASEAVNYGHNLGSTMKYQLGERDFDLSPRALYHLMFGENESIFNRHDTNHRLFQKVESEPWYDRDGVLERVVHAWISGIKEIAFKLYWDSMEQDFVQRIERKDTGHLYIISERRPILRLPHGSRFSILVRYAILRLPEGNARLQTFAEVHWRKENKTTAKTLEKVMLKLLREEMELTGNLIDDAVDSLQGKRDDYSVIAKFGKIKASKIESMAAAEKTITVHLGRRNYFWSAVRSPLNWIINFNMLLVGGLKNWLGKVANVDRVVLFGLILSLFLNLFFFSRSSQQYWKAKWEVKEAEAYVRSIIPSSPAAGSVFSRAIYLRDVDEAILSREVFAGIPNNLCAQKFEDMLTATVYEKDSQELRVSVDAKTEATMDRVQSLRTGLAIERNKLLTQLRMLTTQEYELLHREFLDWLQTEAALCAKARAVVPDLNVAAFETLKQYCVDCNYAVNATALL